MDKRGLSGVITVLLIILLAIAAIMIVWQVVRSTIEQGGEQIGSTVQCIGLDLSIESARCVKNGNLVNVTVKRGTDNIESEDLVVYVTDVNGDSAENNTVDIKIFESKTIKHNLGTGKTFGDTTTVSTGIIMSDGTVCAGASETFNCVI